MRANLDRGQPRPHAPRSRHLTASGGPITMDMSGAEVYASIFALAESPLEKGQLWAGSDDGLVHLTRDGGQTWRTSPPRFARPDCRTAPRSTASRAGRHDAGTAFVVATQYKWDDFRPRSSSTTTRQSWTQRIQGIPADAFTRVVREDVQRKGLLSRARRPASCVLRRRARLAPPPAESARGPVHRPGHPPGRSYRRHAGPVLLDPRPHRHRCASGARPRRPTLPPIAAEPVLRSSNPSRMKARTCRPPRHEPAQRGVRGSSG